VGEQSLPHRSWLELTTSRYFELLLGTSWYFLVLLGTLRYFEERLTYVGEKSLLFYHIVAGFN